MSEVLIDDFDELKDKLERANALLCTLCTGLDHDEIPLPPELLDWWLDFQKPRIHLV